MKNYKEILADFREENPEIPYREAQIVASQIYNDQKDLSDATNEDADQPKTMVFDGDLDPDVIEKRIRASGVLTPSIIQEVAKAYSPDFKLVIGEKDGVNRRVWLEGPVRVPRAKDFIVFLIIQE
jgi:hypothetical protein